MALSWEVRLCCNLIFRLFSRFEGVKYDMNFGILKVFPKYAFMLDFEFLLCVQENFMDWGDSPII